MGFSEALEKTSLLPPDRRTIQQQKPPTANDDEDRYDSVYDVLLVISFVFFTYNTGTAACRSRDNILQLSLIIATYVDFILLFWIGRKLENTPSDNVGKRDRLKIVAWIVVSKLNLLVSFQVAVSLPSPLQIVVYVMAAIFFFASFLLCFVFPSDASTVVTTAAFDEEVLEKDRRVKSMV